MGPPATELAILASKKTGNAFNFSARPVDRFYEKRWYQRHLRTFVGRDSQLYRQDSRLNSPYKSRFCQTFDCLSLSATYEPLSV